MSLINDALKKAQKQRTGDSPPLTAMPSIGGESAGKIAKRDKPVAFNTQLVRLALGAGGLLAVVVIGAIIAFRFTRHPTVAPTTEPVTAPAAPAAKQPAVDTTTKVTPPAASPAVTFTLPVTPVVHEPATAPVSSITASAGTEALPATAAPTTAAPAPTEAKSPAGRSAKAAPARTPEPAPQPPTETPPVKLDSKAVAFIENLRIAGIRASATDSKVLMNDRVYRIGDIVEHELGLKLTAITASSLSFEDERGGRYTRNF
jgi:hypothetical protein